jgi:hypothetical protein
MKAHGNRFLRMFLAPLALLAGSAARCATETPEPRPLEDGYRMMYNLDFASAGQVFASWEERRPEDSMGPASEAAGILFAEFDRLGVLEAQFLLDDEKFLGRTKLTPDPVAHARLNAALSRAEKRALSRLALEPRDPDALLALTLVHGLRADYAALVEKRNLAALKLTRRASDWAKKLLAVDPDCEDAHLATGIGNYLVGSTFAPVRWMLRLAGYDANKQQGVRDLERTAERGRYFAPFARLLLAIAYLRDQNAPHARRILVGLRDEFPANPLFAREISRIDARKK